MTKKVNKRLTVTDLMKEKEKFQTKNDEVAVVFVERLNAEVVIRKPEKSLCVDALRMNRDKNNDTDADVYMVYNTMTEPDLKNKELQKEFGCVLPTDIVEKIFEPGEIASLSEMAFDLAKYKDGGVTIIKN